MRLVYFAIVLLLSLAAHARDAVVEQSRSYGYVIGDIATQRVLLARGFAPEPLPQAGPLGIWLERRSSRVETDRQGRRWLAVEYQIMNSPQVLTMVKVPAWTLAAKGNGEPLQIAEWPISVAPLTPQKPFAQAGLGGLRPDRAAVLVDVAPAKRWMTIWLTGFVLSIAAWGGWFAWRNWRASINQPFAVALRELRGTDETTPQAWHALHRAFDRTAGQVVQTGALAPLFERAPQLTPLRPPIESFFTESAARFFGTPSSGASVSLRALCADLRRIEKRHET